MRIVHIINDIHKVGGAEKMIVDLMEFDNTHECYSLKSDLFKILKMALRSRFLRDSNWYHFHLFPSIYFSLLFRVNSFSIHEHNTWNRRRNSELFRLTDSYVYRRAKFIVCISEGVKLSLDNWLISPSRYVTIPNFIGQKFANSTEHLELMSPFAVMVGSFTPQKRQLELVRCWYNNHVDMNLYLLGDGPQFSKVKNYIKANNIENVYCLGIKDPRPYYLNCEVNILMSNWEGFGNVVIEAAAFNKYTIGSNVDGLNKIIHPSLLCNNEQECIDIIKSRGYVLRKNDRFLKDISQEHTIQKFNNLFKLNIDES